MAITPKPKPGKITTEAQDAFIQGAPDGDRKAVEKAPDEVGAAPYEKGVAKGNKRQITLTIAPDLLRQVDEVAKLTGQARAAIINMAIFRALEGDIFK
jgi:hypothetical protein